MTESHAWSVARQHLAPYLRMVRVENQVGSGTPDWYYISRWGASGWVETKEDLGCLILDQVLWAEEETRYGGRSHMLYRHPGGWALYDAAGMRHVFEDKKAAKDFALVWIHKQFPLRAILSFLAPRKPTLVRQTAT